MPVQSVSQFDPSQFFRLPSTGGTSAIAASNDLSGRLTVTTAEGDKVTLTANLAEDFRTVAYRGKAQQNGTSVEVNAQRTEYSSGQGLGVTVEGDLNEQEVKDLSKLFKKVLNIFRKYFNGQDEAAQAKTAKLADKFGSFSSLSGLDLDVNVERSVSIIAAQSASHNNQRTTEPAALPTNADTATLQTDTPGAAPSAVAAIPPPSSGTPAPTQPSASTNATGKMDEVRLTARTTEDQQPTSLVQQVLDAVHESTVDSHKLRRHLPRLLDKVREELQKELRGETEHKQTTEVPAQTASAAFFSYQSIRQTSVTLSIHT